MLGRLARGAYILTLAVMIAAYAASAATSGPATEPKADEPAEFWYC